MKVKFSKNALKSFKKLDNSISAVILKKLKKIEALDDPRSEGAALVGNFAGLWRYRIGSWRVICQIKDEELIVLVLAVRNRSEAYDEDFDRGE